MQIKKILKLIYRQYFYRKSRGSPISRLRKLILSFQNDCCISPDAFVYEPGKIRFNCNVHIYERAMINYKSGQGRNDVSISFGEGTKIMQEAKLIPQQGFIRIGKDCTVNYGCILYGTGGLEIGDNTRIAAYTVILPMNHIYSDPETPIWHQGETAKGIRIGNDVWIGSGVVILDGVEIGNGAVIGAGSVVTKNIPEFSVAVGVPAKVIKRRDGIVE